MSLTSNKKMRQTKKIFFMINNGIMKQEIKKTDKKYLPGHVVERDHDFAITVVTHKFM